jgi:ubiquinone/menaquinone biosynthesis C-methylase UbiE
MVRTILSLSLYVLVCSACASHSTANKAEPSVAPGANDRYATEEGRAAAIQILEGEGRETYQKPDEVLQHMKLTEGDVVCEVGAGSGYFTPFLSKAVGSTGKVYAEDPQPEFLEVLKQKKEKQRLHNVEIVLGTYTDTNLPDGLCDVTFVLDTYHHFEWPKSMLDAMKRDTKAHGRLVIVDWYRRQNAIFDKWGIDAMQHLRVDVDGVIEEITSHGWNHVETRTFLDHQFFAVFMPR